MHKNTEDDRTQAEEYQWVRDFLAGDREAFERIVRRYQDRIYHLCYRFLGDREEANDCAQDVFVRIFRGLPGFKQDSRLSTWIYRIAVNSCKNRTGSSWFRRRRSEVSLNGGHAGSLQERLADPGESPLSRLTRKERQMQVHRAIGTLPKAARAVILLRDIEGLSYKEIAEITGYREGTVKSKLARARNKLRHKLERML